MDIMAYEWNMSVNISGILVDFSGIWVEYEWDFSGKMVDYAWNIYGISYDLVRFKGILKRILNPIKKKKKHKSWSKINMT